MQHKQLLSGVFEPGFIFPLSKSDEIFIPSVAGSVVLQRSYSWNTGIFLYLLLQKNIICDSAITLE